MCLICIEFERERMTITEARRALGEMSSVVGPEHTEEIEQMLTKAAERGDGKTTARAGDDDDQD